MNKGEGLLEQFDLWGYWENLPIDKRNIILKYFEQTPLMWDYKLLFNGTSQLSNINTSINILNILLVSDDLELCDLIYSEFMKQIPKNLETNGFWTDFHFFLSNYSKRVYRLFLDNQCDESRFVASFIIEFQNIDKIIQSLKANDLFPVRNLIIDQYLIFLEKSKDFKSAVEIISKVRDQGWTNDFNKRLNRCNMKLKQADLL